MENRTAEYQALVNELARPPKELNTSVERARRRARHTRMLRRFTAPLGTVASVAACFVLMVNLFPTFALACSSVPVIRELAAAVAFSPSLSAAVAHDYVQYIGQSQTVDGVKVDLGYAIVDQHQMVFVYSVDGGRFYSSPELLDENGDHIAAAYSTSIVEGDISGQSNGLESMILSFSAPNNLPEQFTINMYFLAEKQPETPAAPVAPQASLGESMEDWTDPRSDPGVLCFTFDVALDMNRIAQPITVPVNRWIELDGQRIQVERLEYTPTRTILYLGEDQANTAWLTSLKFWFEDQSGRRYDETDGSLVSSSTLESPSQLTYYFQSFYYDPPKGLTLCVDKAEWLDKDAPHVVVDLTSGEATGLPAGVELVDARPVGTGVELTILSPKLREQFAQSFSHTYWDPEGGEHEWHQMSTIHVDAEDSDSGEAKHKEVFYLDNYSWDTVELELSYTSVAEYVEPVRVPLAAE